MSIAVYSPEEVDVFIAGVYKLDGYIEGKFLSVNRKDSLFSTSTSSDGMVSRVHNGNMVYTVTVTLASTSESNQVLTYLSLIDFATQMGKFPLFIKDKQGSTLLFSPTTWIEKQPNSDFGLSVEAREWELTCSQAVFNLGGNHSQSSGAMDAINTILGGAAGIQGVSGLIGGLL